MERVVVTGMGTVNPIGKSVVETWDNAVNGVSGVGPITLFDSSDLLVHIACEVKGFEPTRYMEARDARRQDRFEQRQFQIAVPGAINERAQILG